MTPDAQIKRFRRWQQLACAETRFLSECVEVQLVPATEKAGFVRVGVNFQQADWPVSANEIALERVVDDNLDQIDISFAKYGRTRFQLSGARRRLSALDRMLRNCSLIRRSDQYFHVWGKPWWMPNWAWSESKAGTIVSAVTACLPQILRFLETGERGPNISKPVFNEEEAFA